MKKASLTKIAALLLFCFLPLVTGAAEAEDPYYKQWASFSVGSSVTLASKSGDGKGAASFTQTITLKEIANDTVILEIARREEKAAPVIKTRKVDRYARKAVKVEYNGQEEIEAGGKKVTCHAYTVKVMDDSGKERMAFKYWFSPDIPGAAKIRATSQYSDKTNTEQTAIKWEKK